MLYILDTNVFSEVIKKQANPNVAKLMKVHKDDIRLASTVLSELLFGMHLLAEGRRKREIADYIDNGVCKFPLLTHNQQSATIHAEIRATARKKGKTLPFVDSQIASIVLANNAVLVTRNVSDFGDIEGLDVVNWFE